MNVDVIECGERPKVFTRARMAAPRAAQVAGELLGQNHFGDEAHVVLDWTNVLGQLPNEVAKPVLHFVVRKDYPGTGKQLTVTSRLDVDDVFGGTDVMTRSLLEDLIHELSDKIAFEEARKGNEWTQPFSRS